MNKLLLSAIAFSALPFAAFADAPAFNWTGAYVGASAGVAGITTDTKVNDGPYYHIPGKLDSQGGGAIAGLTVGYNYELPSAVVAGLEADYSFSTAGNSGGANEGNIIGQGTNMDSLGTVRGRLGYAMDGNLFFTTGGLAFGDVKAHSVDGLVTDPDAYNRASKTQVGWTAGAGIEHALTNNVTLKLEALYADLGTEKSTDGDGYTMRFQNSATIARAGVNFKF